MVSNQLQYLIDKRIANNLYRCTEMQCKEGYFLSSELDIWIKDNGTDFLDHLYSFPFLSDKQNIVEEVFPFLDQILGVDYKNILFEPGKHHPCIGVYSAISNQLLGIGVGRKNTVFVLCTNPEIGDNSIEEFSSLDYGNVVRKIVDFLQITAVNHEFMCEAINEEDEDCEFEYMDLMKEDFDKVLLVIPNLTSDFAEISPFDYLLNRT